MSSTVLFSNLGWVWRGTGFVHLCHDHKLKWSYCWQLKENFTNHQILVCVVRAGNLSKPLWTEYRTNNITFNATCIRYHVRNLNLGHISRRRVPDSVQHCPRIYRWNNIQLSPEGEVNSGGHKPRREALRRGIYPPLFTNRFSIR